MPRDSTEGWFPTSIVGWVLAFVIGVSLGGLTYLLLGGTPSRTTVGLALMVGTAGGSFAGVILEHPMLARTSQRDLVDLVAHPEIGPFLVALVDLSGPELDEVAAAHFAKRASIERAWNVAQDAAQRTHRIPLLLRAYDRAYALCQGSGIAQEAAGKAAAGLAVRDEIGRSFDELYEPFQSVIPLARVR